MHVREGAGDDAEIFVDANCSLDQYHAITLANWIEEFDISFFEVVGKNAQEGIQYRRVAYESERPEIRAEVPKEGLDVQLEPAYEA